MLRGHPGWTADLRVTPHLDQEVHWYASKIEYEVTFREGDVERGRFGMEFDPLSRLQPSYGHLLGAKHLLDPLPAPATGRAAPPPPVPAVPQPRPAGPQLRFAPDGPVTELELAGLRGGATVTHARTESIDLGRGPDGGSQLWTAQGAPVGYDVRRYLLPRPDGGTHAVQEFTVPLRLEAGDSVSAQQLAALRRSYQQAAELANKGYLLPSGDEFRLRVDLDAPDGYLVRAVDPEVTGRASQLRVPTDAGPPVLMHELLHFLGVKDEYFDAALLDFFRRLPNSSAVHHSGPMTSALHAGDLQLAPRHLATIEETRAATVPLHDTRPGGAGAPGPPALPQEWQAIRADAPVAQVNTVRFDPHAPERQGTSLTGDRTYIRHEVRRLQTAEGEWVREYTLKLSLRPDHPALPPGQHAGPADVQAIEQRLTRVVEHALNGRHRLPGGDQFHLRLEFDAPDPHAVVAVHTGADLPTNQLAWRTTDGDGVLLHEVLHYLGLKDEYLDGAMLFRRNENLTISPGRAEHPTALADELGGNPGVMGRAALDDPQPVLARYVQAIGEQHGSGGGVLHDAPHGADLSWWQALPKPAARPPLELGAVEGPASRVVHWYSAPAAPDGLMVDAVRRIDEFVQEAYDLARADPSAFLHSGSRRLQLFAETYQRWLTGTPEQAREAGRWLPSHFGYAVEELTTGRILTAIEHGDAALAGVRVSFQESVGHTRPDIVITVAGPGGVPVKGWFDLTADGSLGHIFDKSGGGWRTKPYVAEVSYPSLSADRSELGGGADPAVQEQLRLQREAAEVRAEQWDWAIEKIADRLPTPDRYRSGAAEARLVRAALEGIFGDLQPKTVKSLLNRIGAAYPDHSPARHGIATSANDLGRADELIAWYGEHMPGSGRSAPPLPGRTTVLDLLAEPAHRPQPGAGHPHVDHPYVDHPGLAGPAGPPSPPRERFRSTACSPIRRPAAPGAAAAPGTPGPAAGQLAVR